jgi:hypothetical protein
MTSTQLISEARAFLSDYVALWGSDQFASLYHAPSVTLRADSSIHCFQSREEIDRFFKGVAQTYHSEGTRRWDIHNLEVVPLGGRSALITLDWEMLREDGSSIRRWRQSYNVVRIDGKFRVLASTFHIP